MAKRKGKLVEEIRHRSGITVEIRMPDKYTFAAKLPDGEEIRNTDGQKLRNDVYRWLNNNTELEWAPAIEVTKLAPFGLRTGSFVGFGLRRYLIAKKYDGRMAELQWTFRDDDNKVMHMSSGWGEYIEVPCDLGDKVYLPYSETVWTGLIELLNSISHLRERLHEMLVSDEGVDRIAQIGAGILKMLPEGETNE